jgi:hypothetical protein
VSLVFPDGQPWWPATKQANNRGGTETGPCPVRDTRYRLRRLCTSEPVAFWLSVDGSKVGGTNQRHESCLAVEGRPNHQSSVFYRFCGRAGAEMQTRGPVDVWSSCVSTSDHNAGQETGERKREGGQGGRGRPLAVPIRQHSLEWEQISCPNLQMRR